MLMKPRAAAVTAAAGSLRRRVHDHRHPAAPALPGLVVGGQLAHEVGHLGHAGAVRLKMLDTSASCTRYSATSPSVRVSGRTTTHCRWGSSGPTSSARKSAARWLSRAGGTIPPSAHR